MLTNTDLTSRNSTKGEIADTSKQDTSLGSGQASVCPSNHNRSICLLLGLGTENADEAKVSGTPSWPLEDQTLAVAKFVCGSETDRF